VMENLLCMTDSVALSYIDIVGIVALGGLGRQQKSTCKVSAARAGERPIFSPREVRT
jgi:hypothetical protein